MVICRIMYVCIANSPLSLVYFTGSWFWLRRFCHQGKPVCFRSHFIDHLCGCVYIWPRETKKLPINLIDNRCKSPGKEVKGHRCHGNYVWVNGSELGAGTRLGLEDWGEGWGVRVQRSLLQVFFRQRDHFPFPPDRCWCKEVPWCGGIDLDTTPTATSKPQWPNGRYFVRTSSAATLVAGCLQWHTLTAPRPPPICPPPLHAWPFIGIYEQKPTPHGVLFLSSMPTNRTP